MSSHAPGSGKPHGNPAGPLSNSSGAHPAGSPHPANARRPGPPGGPAANAAAATPPAVNGNHSLTHQNQNHRSLAPAAGGPAEYTRYDHDGPGPEYRGAPRTADYRNLDYRNHDYRGLDYRGMDYRGNDYRSMAADEPEDGAIDWAGAVWRYRYALLLPMLLGIALAAAFFTTRPNYYRSTARLVVESDRPTVLDDTGNLVSGVPPAELLLMQLHSDHVINYAINHPLLAETAAAMPPGELGKLLTENLVFEDALRRTKSDTAVAFLLHFDDTNPQFAVNAVAALSAGLQNFFTERSEAATSELKALITTAKDRLIPDLNQLEAEYRDFRESTELSWDKSGTMINPFREKQVQLQVRRLEIEDTMRDLGTKMTALHDVIESTQNPLLVVEVARQLMGDEMNSVRALLLEEKRLVTDRAIQDEDYSLNSISLERELIPLQLEREQLAAQYAPGHPLIKQLDQRLVAMRERLNEVIAQETARKQELRRELESPTGDELKARMAQAEMLVSGFVTALETREMVLRSQLSLIDEQIARLGDEAMKLAKAESDNDMYLRRIERAQKLLDQVEEQMTRINLANQDSSISVTQLNPPSLPTLISPILLKFLAVGAILGLLAGGGLVYLLESKSRTYRSSEEIAQTLGMRVLAHIPVDSHKLPKVRKGEVYAYQDIDPGLSSIHRPNSMTTESVRRLRTSVLFEANALGAQCIQVTSPLPEDGKSTLAGNLAASIAQTGKTVVLLDADLRRPQTSASFSLSDRPGLTDLISGEIAPEAAVHPTPVENLSVAPSGPIPANPAEALSMPQFGEFLEWLKQRYDYVIVDTPPLLIVTDPAIVASAVDALILTFRVRRGCRPQSKESAAILRGVGKTIIGCVVNRVDSTTGSSGYSDHYTSSYHYYGNRYSQYAKSAGAEGRKVVRRPSNNRLEPADTADQQA